MARLPPLLPTPPASLKLRDTDAVESGPPKRHRPLEPPTRPEDLGSRRHREPSPLPSSRRRRSRSPPPSKVRRRSRSPPPSNVRRRSRSPPPSNVRRRSRSPPSKVRRRSRSPPPSNVRRRSRSPPSKVWRRSRSPPPSNVRCRSRSPRYVSSTQRLAERQHAKRPSAEAAVEGERLRPSSLDDSLLENRPSHSIRSCEHPETSSAAVEKIPDPAIRVDEQKLDCHKMDRNNQSNDKAPSRSARRKKMKRQIMAEAKKEMREHPETSSPAVEKRPDSEIRGYEHQLHSEKMDVKNQSGNKAPSRNASRKKTRREIWAEAKKEFREMKKDKLLENIKKLQACVLLLEKDGADMAEIMEFRSMLESTKKQYVENEAELAKEGSSAPLQVLKRDRLEKTAVPERNKLAEEVKRLKSELETVRQDRDDQLAQAQSLMADVAKQKEVARRYGVELEDAMMRIAALEKGCLLRRETIEALQAQLASANERLTVPSPTRDLMPS